MASRGSVQVECIRPLNRVIRWRRDHVGNDLTCVLRWCATHDEPVWQYGDGSFGCPHEAVVGWSPEPHEITDGPWEEREVGDRGE